MAEGQAGTSSETMNMNMENRENTYNHSTVINYQVSVQKKIKYDHCNDNFVPKKIEDLIFELPGPPKHTIVGRDENVVEITDLFKKGDDRSVAICGLGGMGKTTLAIYCADVWRGNRRISNQIGHESFEYFRNVFYLSVESRQNFESSAKRLAKKLNVQQDQRITEIWRDILKLYKDDRLLIIIDNLVKLADVSDLLEIKDNGLYILATTQNRDIDPPFRVRMLDTISKAEGLELFLTVTEHQMDRNENIKKDFLSCFNELFNKMEGLPISVCHAATNIDQHMKSNVKNGLMEPTTEYYTTLLREYMADFNSRLREEFPEQFRTQISKSAYTALTVNIDKLSSDHSKRLLSILCYLDPAGIQVEEMFDESFMNKTDRELAIDGLTKYSLIYIEKQYYVGRVIRIHRLVQDVARTYLESEIGVNMVQFIMSICTRKGGNLWFMIAHLGGTKKISEWFNSCSKENLKAVVDRMFELKKRNLTLDRLRDAGCDVRDGANWPLPHKLMAMVELYETDASVFFLIFDWIFKEFNAECLAGAEDGLTLHHVAAANWELEIHNIYKYLVEKGEEKDIKKGTTRRQLSPLHVLYCGKYQDVSRMVGLGADVNARDVDGNTPLHAAARRNGLYIVDALLEQPDVQVDAENVYHETPLMVAAENYCFWAARKLMRAGARYDFRLENGDTILHRAAKYHQVGFIKWILDRIKKDAQIGVNDVNVDGDTPAHLAVSRKYRDDGYLIRPYHIFDTLEQLVRAGADLNMKNNRGQTPFDLAEAMQFSEYLIDCLKIYNFINKTNARYDFRWENGDTILHRAAKYHDDKLIVRILDRIKKDAQIGVNDVNVDGDTPAHLAVSREYDGDGDSTYHFRIIRTLKQLVSAGADLNIKNNRGQTPFDLAEAMQLSEKKIDCIKICNIINKTNARYDFRWENGDTILHRAAKYHKEELMECILDRIKKDAQISVNDVNVDGDTPAHLAISWEYHNNGKPRQNPSYIIDTLTQLVRAGADLNMKNNQGKTPLDLAEAMQLSEEVIDYLKIYNIINKNNSRYDFRWENGDTILHRAAKYHEGRYIRFILYCIKKDAQIGVNDVNVDGDTPAHLAVSRKYDDDGDPIDPYYIIDTLVHLMSAGANVNIKNNRGETPFDLTEAMQLSEEVIDYLKIYNIINKTNARYDFRLENGDTILHRAAKYHEHKLIKCILDRIKKDAQIGVNDVNEDGDTPAHLAVSRKYYGDGYPIDPFDIFDTLEQLVSAGANVNKKNNRGKTPLDLARTEKL